MVVPMNMAVEGKEVEVKIDKYENKILLGSIN